MLIAFAAAASHPLLGVIVVGWAVIGLLNVLVD